MENKDKAFNRIKNELEKVSEEMLVIINKYNLQVDNPLEIINTAKELITDKDDYVKFIELSLQGRLLGEAAAHLESSEFRN
ncbi:MAG: hypothetical protein ACPG8V_02245 [Alphaproteobacteria bacterium]